MKSITIHKVEEPIVELIRQRADAEGISVNQVVKKLIEEALGVKPSKSSRHAEDCSGIKKLRLQLRSSLGISIYS